MAYILQDMSIMLYVTNFLNIYILVKQKWRLNIRLFTMCKFHCSVYFEKSLQQSKNLYTFAKIN